MKSSFDHLQLNVSDPNKSFPFYKDLLGYLGFGIILGEGEDYLGLGNGVISFWIMAVGEKHRQALFHRKKTGINHLSFKVQAREDVDIFAREFLQPRDIAPLYDSPREYPEYTPDYYAVYFEDPDRLKLEVAFHSH